MIPGLGINGFIGTAAPAYGKYKLAVTGYGIFVSSDYGASFSKRYDGVFGNSAKTAISDSGQYMLVNSSYHGIVFSSDYGENWTRTNSEVYAWYGACMSSTGQYIGKYNSSTKILHISLDYGATFTRTWTPLYGYNIDNVYVNATGQYWLAPTQSYNFWWYSTNYGVTWYTVGVGGYYYDNAAFSESGQYSILSCGANTGNVQVSNNYSASYQSANTSYYVQGAVGISGNGQYMYSAYTSYMHRSANYGVNWTTSVYNNAFFGAVTAINVSYSGQFVIVACSTGAVISSSDFGVSWQEVFPAQNILSMQTSPLII